MKANVIVFEVSMFLLAPVFYYGLKRALGKSRGRAYLFGALAFSLAIQTIAVLCGMMNFYWYSSNSYYKHYPLGGYIIWLGIVPLAAMLLFYVVSATCYLASMWIVRKPNIWARSAVAGAIAVVFYLMAEPIAVTNHWWAWNAKSFYLIDVPLFAWIGVFLAVFLYNVAFQLTVIDMKDPKPLGQIEDRTIKRWLKCKKPTRNLNWGRLEAVYLFRLLIALVIYGAVMTPLIAILWAVANRGRIPPGW
jgi:hypothetical protein